MKHFYYGCGHLLSIALDRLGRLHRRDVFTGEAQRPAPCRWSRRWDYDYRNNLVREERDDDLFNATRWQYDRAGRLLLQDGDLPGRELWRWDNAGNPLDAADALPPVHNRVTQLNGIRWRYDVHGRTVEKDNGHTRWQYRYDTEHRLTDVVSLPRRHNAPQVHVSFRYDPLGRRISKTRWQTLHGEPQGKTVTTRFIWEGFRLLQEIRDGLPLTYVYADPDSYEPLARIDGVTAPEIFWFHCQPNGTPEQLTDAEGRLRWEGRNGAWGKLLHESPQPDPVAAQNLRMQGQYLDRETGLHYNLFRYYDPDCGRFTQPDPIGLLGGLNLYQYAPNALGWIDPWGLDVIRLRHYTSNQGLSGIKETMVIRAGDQNAVFATKAKGKPLSMADAAEKFKIKQNHARNYIDFDINESRVEYRTNDLGVEEYKIKGDVELNKKTTKFNKRC